MRKVLFIVALVAMVASSVFAQEGERSFTVSQSAKVQYRFGNDGWKENAGLKRFRSQYEITAENEFVSLWYRARLNGNSWADFNWTSADPFWNCIIPAYNGGSASQANLIFTPLGGALKVGIGTDLWWQLPGATSLSDDDYYQLGSGINSTTGKNVHLAPAWGGYSKNLMFAPDDSREFLVGVATGMSSHILRPYLAAVDGVAVQYNAPFGLSVTASVPWQNLNEGNGDDLLMRWGLSYGLTLGENKIFNLGLGLASTFNSGNNPWSLYAGVEIPCVPVVQPKLFYMAMMKAKNDYNTDITNDIVGHHTIGLAVPGSIGNFSFTPEFAIGFFQIADYDGDEITDETKAWYKTKETLNDLYGPQIFFAIPVAYKINDVCTVDLWFSGDFGSQRKTEGGDFDAFEHRFVVKPGVTVSTPFGKFNAQVGLLIDTEFQIDEKESGTKCGYLADVSWSINF